MHSGLEIRFDGWTLLVKSGELVRDGKTSRLQDQPLLILQALLMHPHELVRREELIALLWPRGIVEFDAALNSAVRRLRIALGDEAETPRYIETIPRRGYRFIGSVESPEVETPTVQPPPARPRHWWWTAVLLIVAGINAVFIGGDTPSARAATLPLAEQPGRHSPGLLASVPAYEHLMQGNFFYKRREPGDLERAERSYRNALEIDPRSGRTWASLASVYWIQTVTKAIPNETGLEKVRQAAEKALDLDPTTAEAHMRLANYFWATGRHAVADEHVRKAAELDPNNSLVRSILASTAASEHRFDEAVALMRANVAADPLSVLDRYNLGSFLFFAERFAEARLELSKARELSTVYDPDLIGFSLILERKFAEGLRLVQRWPDGAARAQCLAMLYHALGRPPDADAALAHLIELAGGSDPFRIAEVHAYRGDADAAFEWLQRSLGPLRDEPRTWPTRKGWLMRVSPFVKPLRGDARWDAWVAATRGSG